MTEAKVVHINYFSSAQRVLDSSKHLEKVLVMGYNGAGQLEFRGNNFTNAEANYIVDQFKKEIVS